MEKRLITLYEFEELSKNVQQQVLDYFININVNCTWWEYIYEDAKSIGLSIQGFNLFRDTISADFNLDEDKVKKLILEKHGEDCLTYQIALNSTNFEYAIKEEYLDILREEYEYLTSTESIKETIADYLFLEDGTHFDS